MNADFLRYTCQITLPGFGEKAQTLLQNAKVLIVGAGGLGCPAAQYLAAAGIGTIAIADYDKVSTSNLHRQILYGPADVGQMKVVVACSKLIYQNSNIQLIPIETKITAENVLKIIESFDILVDCTDNFETRYLLNDAAVLTGKPIVYGAIYQYEGQVAVWNVKNKDGLYTPNYRDLFPEVDASQIPDCAEGGVIPTLAGIIGCMQANEVIKYITNTGELLSGKIMTFDAQTMQSRVIKIGSRTNVTIKNLPQTSYIPGVSPEELKKALNQNSVELIDIRTLSERDNLDIGGIHIPIEDIFDYFENADKRIKTILYCASGKRSAETVKIILKKYPDANILSLQGGIKAWFEAGLD